MSEILLTKNDLQRDSRNYGIDLLRILSMLMVVILHTLGAGGVLDAVAPFSLPYYSAWTLEILCYCAVNIFALISGYVGITSKHNLANLATLTTQVLFYTVVLTLIIGVACPGLLTAKDWIKGFYPFQHWYFTAYFCLFFFLPLINRGLQALTRAQLLWLSAFMTVLLCILPTALGRDLFQTGMGYSPLWLGYVYVIGATLRLCTTAGKMHRGLGIAIYFGATALTLGSKILMEYFTPLIFGEVRYSELLIRYDSPTMVAAAVGLLLFFATFNIKGFAKRVVAFLSPLAFSVYLIHEFPLLKNQLISGRFIFLADLPSLVIPLVTVGIALSIYALCTLIEIPRFYLFKWLKVKQKFQNQIEKISRKLKISLQ